MRILFDHDTPRPLRRYLTEHTIDTADEMGWARSEMETCWTTRKGKATRL